MQALQNNVALQGESEQKTRRERKSKSPKQRREKKEDNGEKKEKVPRERKPMEAWKQSRRVFNDILKVKTFVDSIGGEQTVKDMKKAFNNAMKRGTAGEQKEQWEIFGKLMENYSAHIGDRKDELFVENKGKRSGADGEPLNESLNGQRAVI